MGWSLGGSDGSTTTTRVCRSLDCQSATPPLIIMAPELEDASTPRFSTYSTFH